jgi:hypothetical protein
LQEYGTISDQAVIVGVKDESLDVYLFRIGVPVRAGINVSNRLSFACDQGSLLQNLPLDHPRTNYQKLSTNQGAELTIYWKDNDPPQTVKQVLRPFDVVNVDIMSEFDMNMKKLKLTVRLFCSGKLIFTYAPLSFPRVGSTASSQRRKAQHISRSLLINVARNARCYSATARFRSVL